jgi:hypothetical protein
VFERTYWSDKVYEVSDDPAMACITLYYKLENGGRIGRITCIHRLGYDEEYIIASSHDPSKNLEQFWILNKLNDNKHNNSTDIVEGPYTDEQFQIEIKKLNIENIKFVKTWK